MFLVLFNKDVSIMKDDQLQEKLDDQLQEKLDFTKSLTNLSVIHVMPATGKPVTGITVLDGKVFVVKDTSEVFVYNSTTFTLTNNFVISCPGSNLGSIVSCAYYNCLYAVDPGKSKLNKYDLSKNVKTEWAVSIDCWVLSVARYCHLLVTFNIL